VARISRDTKVDALSRAPLFEGLSRRELEEIARSSEDMDVEAGRVLCREGGLGQEFFVITEGEAEVRRGGRRRGVLGPGDFFGEIALIERSPRTATVTASTPLRFFVLTRRSFWSTLEGNPAVERKILRALARRALADSQG
jgi:CRP/FNR family cyclic AMP-dependent transcriptional regulator